MTVLANILKFLLLVEPFRTTRVVVVLINISILFRKVLGLYITVCAMGVVGGRGRSVVSVSRC